MPGGLIRRLARTHCATAALESPGRQRSTTPGCDASFFGENPEGLGRYS